MSEFRRRLMMQTMSGGGGGIPVEGAPNGVYILGLDNKLYTSEEWGLPNESAVGVAVLDTRHPNGGFVIAKEDGGYKIWGAIKVISGVITTSDLESAKKDYLGVDNTKQIVLQDSTAESAKYCDSYIFPNGNKGYLPALGEWSIAYDSKEEVDSCMIKINGEPIKTNDYYWVSTQETADGAWSPFWKDGDMSILAKELSNYTRPFTTLQ